MDLLENLGIEVDQVSQTLTIVSLSVTERVLQPFGLVHGGINAVLAETAASLGGNAAAGPGKVCLGVDLTTHHLAAAKKGRLVASATPLHLGKTVQTWQVKVENEGRLTSVSTVTLLVKERPSTDKLA